MIQNVFFYFRSTEPIEGNTVPSAIYSVTIDLTGKRSSADKQINRSRFSADLADCLSVIRETIDVVSAVKRIFGPIWQYLAISFLNS